MRQAVVTKYLGPTNGRGSRVKARAQAGSITVDWNHALNPADNHALAARTLATKWGWAGVWQGGALPGGDGYAFTVSDDDAFTVERAE